MAAPKETPREDVSDHGSGNSVGDSTLNRIMLVQIIDLPLVEFINFLARDFKDF